MGTNSAWVELMGWGARGVLALLFLLSIWSVAIMFDRRKTFKELIGKVDGNEVRKLIQTKDHAALKDLAGRSQGLVAGMLRAMLAVSPDAESVDRSVQSYLADQRRTLDSGLNVLATLGSNAPFIGLFGTVMGIIQSFGILSSQQGQAMNAVMLGLAEALIATAVGLFVAIPAVVAYNTFGQRLRREFSECQAIKDLFVSRLK